MLENLLATKLHIPRSRRDILARSRLIDCLNDSLRGKLTIVSAPAGYGKTTTLVDWTDHSRKKTGWLSLDESDNDLTRFLIYLIAAIQELDESIGRDIQTALRESQAPSIEILLTRLVNDIESVMDESRYENQFVLIIDDYHLIRTQSVHDALNFLLDNLPNSMHLMIAGRSDPPIPISRLRVQGEVIEMRTPDLRFTKSEAAAFLNDLMGLDLSTEEISALDQRTEGWIASLQLAALSMQGRGDIESFITEFSGSHRYVIDYLIDEVISRQPENLQGFLCQTSILDRFCAPLCDATLEIAKSRQILDKLENANLFLIPLDDERYWYRYHHLFADFLGQRLREADPGHIPDLHRRASQWYEDESLMDEAIQHALTAEDMERATRLVDQIAADLLVRRESNQLLKLVNRLPPNHCRDYPLLCIWHAWALLFIGRLETVEPVLQTAEANKGKLPGTPIPGYANTVRAYVANQRGELRKAIKLSEQALEQMPDAPGDQITPIFRGAAIIWLGVNHRYLGDLEKANQYFKQAVGINQEAKNYYGALASFEQSAELAVIRGQLHHAVEIHRRGLQMAQGWVDEGGKGRGASVAESGLHLQLGTVLYQWNDLTGAAPHIQRAVELQDLGEVWGRIFSYGMLAYLKQAEGDYTTAYNLLNKVHDIWENIGVNQLNITGLPSLEKLGILLSQAHPDMAHLLTDAAQRVERQGIQPDDKIDFSSPLGYRHESRYSDLVRVLIALDHAGEAIPLLERLLGAARSMGRRGDEIRYLRLMALASQAVEDEVSAINVLNQALALAKPEGYVRVFVDEGEPMATLLALAVSQEIEPDYASELLSAFPEQVQKDVKFDIELTTGIQTLVEPLSERELDVLRLMAAGDKYDEVANKLVISVNTVRHHTRNIYSKLDVNNRTQAISRAQELGIL